MRLAALNQDNKSTIALENGSATNERSRNINIIFFFVSDRVQKCEVEVKYTPTDLMLADMLTKPLQGKKITDMRDTVLGHVPTTSNSN